MQDSNQPISGKSFFDFLDELAISAAASIPQVAERSHRQGRPRTKDGGGTRAGGWDPPPGVAVGPSAYLESIGNIVTDENGEMIERLELRSCGCRSRFCPHCCTDLGLALRVRLIPVLQTFIGLQMWTFTIDPKLFSSPASAFEYVREKRCISRMMRELKREGYLHSGKYVVVVEWQKNTEMPHWHVLVDSTNIPFANACEVWNRFRPASAGPVEGDRPGFGSIRFSMPKFKSAIHAAHYACKYLIKYPEHGYPAWVLASSDIHRFSTSRGFWPNEQEPDVEPTAPEDMLEVDEQLFESEQENDDENKDDSRTTIAERLAACGTTTILLRVHEEIDPTTGQVQEVRSFVGRFNRTLQECAASLERSFLPGERKLELHYSELARLFRLPIDNVS